MAISLSFSDTNYSEANKPSVETLKADLVSIENDHNSHVANSLIHTALSTIYPIGCIYTSTIETNPALIFGFGTWTAFGSGRTLVGVDTGQTEFDTVEETGGHKALAAHTHKVDPPATTSAGQSQSHTHAVSMTTTVDPDHGHHTSNIPANSPSPSQGGSYTTGVANQDHTHTVDIAEFDSGSAGTGDSGNLQPYITVYFFKRTA